MVKFRDCTYLLAALSFVNLISFSQVANAAGSDKWIATPLKQITNHSKDNPHKIWDAEDEIGNGASIYINEIEFKDDAGPKGKVIISEIVNAENCSPSSCAVRVIFEPKNGKKQILQNYEQMCSASSTFFINRSLTKIKSCNKALNLQKIK